MKILDLLGLTELVELCKETFASITHKHSVNDITDYTVDDAFSATSTNPVENRVINNALVTIANEMDTLESNISKLNDEKADASDIPTKISELTNDSGFITSSTVNTSISTHNIATDSHNDIRLLISALTTQVNNFLDVDDTTKDQLSEIIALIDANADDIESITSGKVNVSDIIDNLTTNVSNKPLSAAQGVAINGLIVELQDALNLDKTNLTNHINDTNPHGVNEKISNAIRLNSDLIKTESFDEIEAEVPTISPVVENRFSSVENRITSLEQELSASITRLASI